MKNGKNMRNMGDFWENMEQNMGIMRNMGHVDSLFQ